MSRQRYEHLTVDDLLKSRSSGDTFAVEADKCGKPRVIRKKTKQTIETYELYENETALKKAAADLIATIPRIELFKTDNGALRVRGGVRVRSREPGMTDQHLCVMGLFVAIEAKMPGKDLDPELKQPEYRDKVLRGEGIHITYHSLHELVAKMKKHRLLNRNFKL